MFQNPFLRQMQLLYAEASHPKNSVWAGGDSSKCWEQFHSLTKAGLGITDKKKALEANKLILFALYYAEFPDGIISVHEPPDFILSTQDREIGIELTDVYVELLNHSHMPHQEKIKSKIVQKAFDYHRRNGGERVNASFTFESNTHYCDSDVDQIAEHLAKCIPASLSRSKELLTVWREPHWPPGLEWLMGRSPMSYEGDDHLWELDLTGSVYSSEDFIQKTLDKKETRLGGYRKAGCDEFWLLLIIPGQSPASFMSQPKSGYSFKTSFDRVFAYWLCPEKIVVIK